MSDFVLAILLGVVEGITEFLPISSTAHLRIFQHLAGVSLEDEYWKLFAIFIQLGAILAVIVLYRKRLRDFLRAVTSFALFQKNTVLNHPVTLITAAFICTAVPALLLKKVIGHNLESLHVMVASLAIGGVVMIVVDLWATRGKVQQVEEMKLWQAIFVGLCQVFSAVFPGTSRSMSTIAAGQLVGLNRATALEFSFLISIPVMIAATVYDLFRYVKETAVGLSLEQLGLLSVGFIVSFVVAYVVVAWFLGYVRKHGFIPFGIYRILLAALLFWLI